MLASLGGPLRVKSPRPFISHPTGWNHNFLDSEPDYLVTKVSP